MKSSTAFDLSAYLEVDERALWDEPEDAADGGAPALGAAGAASGAPQPELGAPHRAAGPEPSESIEGLLAALPQYRRLFLDVMLLAEEPRGEEYLCGYIASFQRASRSVYAPEVLCGLLERAGALARVGADGGPLEAPEVGPREEVGENGEAYLVVAEAPTWLWKSTEEALAFARRDDPLGRLTALFEEEAALKGAYRYILEACASEGGAAMADLSDAVNALPEVAAQRRRAGYFVDKLEKCDAIAWDGTWHTTEVGRAFLSADGV